MEIISDLNELKEISESGSVGWLLHTEKNHINGNNDNYLNILKMLKKDNDIVVADLCDFLLLNTIWFKPENIRSTPMIGIDWCETVEMYKNYMDGYADYLFIQEHDLQIQNFVTNIKKLQEYKDFIKSYSSVFDLQYEKNYLVLKTTILRLYILKHHYKIDINSSMNLWRCGYRAFIYKDFCEKHLDINMDIISPLRTPGGLMLTETNPSAIQQSIMTIVNNKLMKVTDFSMSNLKRTFKNNKEVKSIHHFNDERIFKGDIIEILVEVEYRRFRVLHYFE